MKYTIQDLADGKVAMTLEPTTTPEQLKEVLTKAFPDDWFCKGEVEEFRVYMAAYPGENYYKSTTLDTEWQSSKTTKLPTTSINTFLDVKLEHGKWYKRVDPEFEGCILRYDSQDIFNCYGYWRVRGWGTWGFNEDPNEWIPATKEDLAKLGNEWEPYWEDTIEEKKQAFEKAIDEHLERGLYPEYKVGQKVKIHSGSNNGRSNGKIGVITEVDTKYFLQPCLEVEVEGETYCIYPNPEQGREFNVEILEEPCNQSVEVVIEKGDPTITGSDKITGYATSVENVESFVNSGNIYVGANVQESDCEFQSIATNIADLLAYKNAKYGASALNPINIFNGKTKVGQRVDDKISRIQNNPMLQKNDVVDLIGYLILICKENNWTTFEEFKD